MEQMEMTIRDLSVDEREEIFVNIADVLEGTAREALMEGNQQFAAMSSNMAEAIRLHSDVLVHDDLDAAEVVLQQASEMISQFNAEHPYRMVSSAIH